MNYLTQSSRTNSSMNYSFFIFKPNIHCILLDLNQPKLLGLVLMVIITCLDLLISQAINYEYKYIYTCKLKHLLALKCFLATKNLWNMNESSQINIDMIVNLPPTQTLIC